MLSSHLHTPRLQLIWSDEFDYEGLPDKAKWDYEEGFVRNQEMQYYTRARQENARVENGMLIIEGRKEQWDNPTFKPGSKKWSERRELAQYTSASLVTRYKVDCQNSRIEVRAKLPHGQGVWPAIWTLGANAKKIRWPRCGEIDIMEYVGKSPDIIYANVHYFGDDKHCSYEGKVQIEKPYTDFHTYAIEWYSNRIDFFFDHLRYHTFLIEQAGQDAANPFRKPHVLIINLALGGTQKKAIDDNVLPQHYLIDYVRVYKKIDNKPTHDGYHKP